MSNTAPQRCDLSPGNHCIGSLEVDEAVTGTQPVPEVSGGSPLPPSLRGNRMRPQIVPIADGWRAKASGRQLFRASPDFCRGHAMSSEHVALRVHGFPSPLGRSIQLTGTNVTGGYRLSSGDRGRGRVVRRRRLEHSLECDQVPKYLVVAENGYSGEASSIPQERIAMCALKGGYSSDDDCAAKVVPGVNVEFGVSVQPLSKVARNCRQLGLYLAHGTAELSVRRVDRLIPLATPIGGVAHESGRWGLDLNDHSRSSNRIRA